MASHQLQGVLRRNLNISGEQISVPCLGMIVCEESKSRRDSIEVKVKLPRCLNLIATVLATADLLPLIMGSI